MSNTPNSAKHLAESTNYSEASLYAKADISQGQAAETAQQLFIRNCHRYTIAANRVLVRDGDLADNIFLIIEGSAAIAMEDDDGRELVLCRINETEFFGEQPLFSGAAHYENWVTAREECEIGEMSYRQFRLLANKHPELLLAVTGQLSRQLQHSNNKLLDLAFLDVTTRIRRTLIEMSNEPDALTHGQGRTVYSSRQGLAKLVGCSREMASRVIKSLEKQGLIQSQGKKILIYQHALDS